MRALRLFFIVLALSCKKKMTERDCDALLDRYASFVVTERMPDASAEVIASERQREREAARMDDNFKSCGTQLTEEEYRCAMAAKSADAIEKCLE